MTASRSDFSKHLSAGNANQADTRRSPTTALARRSAARRISGPSGIGQELAAKAAPARDDARSPPLDRIHPPAIHRKTDAVDVGGGRRAQEGDHAAGFLRRREADGGHAGAHRRAHFVFRLALGGALAAPALLAAPGPGETPQPYIDADTLRGHLARPPLSPCPPPP